PVSAAAGQGVRETFLHIDTTSLLSAAGEGASISALTLTAKEDPAAGGNANTSGAATKVVAVPILGEFQDGARAASCSEAPTLAEGPKVPGTRGGDGTWTFDLSEIANDWSQGAFPDDGV